MANCDFEDAYLESVVFPDADLLNASFIDATFQQVDFTGYEGVTNLREAAFDNVIIHSSGRFSGMILPGDPNQMKGADFVNSELSRDHIPEVVESDAIWYAQRLSEVANINNTPLEEWLAEHAVEAAR